MLMHPDAMRLIAANLGRIDADLRENPEAVRIFMDLLLKHGNPERALPGGQAGARYGAGPCQP